MLNRVKYSVKPVLFPSLPFAVFKATAVVLYLKHRVMQCTIVVLCIWNPMAPQANVSE